MFKATVLAKLTKRKKVFYSLGFLGDTPTYYPVSEIYMSELEASLDMFNRYGRSMSQH